MLEVLPLHALREEDGPLVGSSLINLSKLAQNGFPVASGVVVLPPEFALKTILSHLNLKDKEIFEQRLEIIKAEVKKIPIPQVLEQELLKRKLNSLKLWHHLLDFWLAEIRSKIWREGLGQGVSLGLSAQPVLFTGEIISYGKASFDYEAKKVVIEIQSGKLNDEINIEIQDLVQKANKKLLLPFIYDWIIDSKKLKFSKISAYTQPPSEEIEQKLVPSRSGDEKKLTESSVKIFLHLDESLRTEENVDGFFISSEKIVENDKKLHQLLEAAMISSKSGVIYKLSDTHDQFGGIKGTLKLIHSPEVLKRDIEAIKFVRNKRGRLNCHLAIPFCRSVEEYLELKRQLMSLGISRSGSIQYFLELSVPENLINLENYLEAGFDGAILELDVLAGWLGGFDPSHHESFYYKKQIAALIEFIEPALKLLHKYGVPFIVKGDLSLQDDILGFLIEKGVWGLIVNHPDATTIHQRIRLIEQRVVKHRVARKSVSQREMPQY